MKEEDLKEIEDAILVGFAGWYLRMKWWKKRMEIWEKRENWRYWSKGEGKRHSKKYWWENFEK
jgi:hypothetical protein